MALRLILCRTLVYRKSTGLDPCLGRRGGLAAGSATLVVLCKHCNELCLLHPGGQRRT